MQHSPGDMTRYSHGSMRGKGLTIALGAEIMLLGEALARVADFALQHPVANNVALRAAETGAATGLAAGLVQGGLGALAIRPMRESGFWQRQIDRQAKGAAKYETSGAWGKRLRHFSTSIFAGSLFNMMRAHVTDPDRTVKADQRDVARSSLEATVSAAVAIGSLAYIGLQNTQPETISNVINDPRVGAGLVVGFMLTNADMIAQIVRYRWHGQQGQPDSDTPLP